MGKIKTTKKRPKTAYVSLTLSEELNEALEAEQVAIQTATGIRPGKSTLLKKALCERYKLDYAYMKIS